MAEINCCSGSTCQDLVTIGFMQELAASGGCTTINVPAGFSSCCEANGSAYTPTYGEIVSSAYPQRVLVDEDPYNDVNGFSASSANVSVFSSCCGSIAASGQNLMKSDLEYGFTEISAVTHHVTKYPTICNTNFTIEHTDTYGRYRFFCNEDSVSGTVSAISVTLSSKTINSHLDKNYGDISNGSSHVTISSGISSSSTVDRCSGKVASAYTLFYESAYTVSITINCPSSTEKIPCTGGTITAEISGQQCENEASITSSRLEPNEPITSATTDNIHYTFKIGQNNNNLNSSKLILDIKIGDKTGTVECTFNRQTCGITPVTTNHIKCGAFPGDDDWCKKNGNTVVCYNCDGTPVNN